METDDWVAGWAKIRDNGPVWFVLRYGVLWGGAFAGLFPAVFSIVFSIAIGDLTFSRLNFGRAYEITLPWALVGGVAWAVAIWLIYERRYQSLDWEARERRDGGVRKQVSQAFRR